MSNIITARVKIKGTRPLLWNAFTPDAIPLKKTEKTGVAGNDPDEWRKRVLITKDRQLYVEPTYIFGCLRDAAKHTKKGKGSLQPLITATLQIQDERILTDRYLPEDGQLNRDPEQPVYLDVRSAKNPSTRAHNVRYRIAAAPGWIVTFNIEWDKTIISRQEMEAVVIDAGRLTGLGDGRSIGFGRFAVEEFDITADS
ncbi:MAG: hypothetical protein HS126_00055 [Anaerolineales bacterium]|nr:hypothetical protein [Anaerolineales bacterium]